MKSCVLFSGLIRAINYTLELLSQNLSGVIERLRLLNNNRYNLNVDIFILLFFTTYLLKSCWKQLKRTYSATVKVNVSNSGQWTGDYGKLIILFCLFFLKFSLFSLWICKVNQGSHTASNCHGFILSHLTADKDFPFEYSTISIELLDICIYLPNRPGTFEQLVSS